MWAMPRATVHHGRGPVRRALAERVALKGPVERKHSMFASGAFQREMCPGAEIKRLLIS